MIPSPTSKRRPLPTALQCSDGNPSRHGRRGAARVIFSRALAHFHSYRSVPLRLRVNSILLPGLARTFIPEQNRLSAKIAELAHLSVLSHPVVGVVPTSTTGPKAPCPQIQSIRSTL